MSKTKAKTKTYLFHEISSYLPLLEGEEFDALVEDIKEFGQIEPAVLFEGKIIDGRNRYRACKQLGIELQVREWKPSESTGMTPLQFVISENIMRRHLNTAQKAEIGLLLLPEIEKESQERKKEIGKIAGQMTNLKDDEEGRLAKTSLSKKIENLSKGESVDIAGAKVKIHGTTLSQAKKIKEIAEKEPIIAEEWEKAKREEQGVRAVYEKAKIIENIETLPKKQQEEIKIKISTEPVSKVIEVVKEKKDEQKRLEDARKYREMEKKKQEMEKLRLQIRGFEKRIGELENAIKSVNANLKVLTEEASKKYPDFTSNDPDYILTKLGVYYDGLKMGAYDLQLEKLREEYDKLEVPLKKQLEKLEEEYETKKKVIEEEKSKKSQEAIWIETHQDSMLAEYDKLEIYKRKIEENKEKLNQLKERYDSEFKDREGI